MEVDKEEFAKKIVFDLLEYSRIDDIRPSEAIEEIFPKQVEVLRSEK